MEASLKLVNAIRESHGCYPTTGYPKVASEPTDLSQLKAAGKAIFSGAASWYGGRFHGRRAADGSRFDQMGLTAAHRSLPFGTKLLVTNRRTGNSCVVSVNDRGPFVGDRVIDLSRGAAATTQYDLVRCGDGRLRSSSLVL